MIAKNLSGKLLKFQKSLPYMFFQMFYFVFLVLCIKVSGVESTEGRVLMLQSKAPIETLILINVYVYCFFLFC